MRWTISQRLLRCYKRRARSCTRGRVFRISRVCVTRSLASHPGGRAGRPVGDADDARSNIVGNKLYKDRGKCESGAGIDRLESVDLFPFVIVRDAQIAGVSPGREQRVECNRSLSEIHSTICLPTLRYNAFFPPSPVFSARVRSPRVSL
jgi:hypothetical protein